MVKALIFSFMKVYKNRTARFWRAVSVSISEAITLLGQRSLLF